MVKQNKSPPASATLEGERSVLDCPYKSFRLHIYSTAAIVVLGTGVTLGYVKAENNQIKKFEENRSKQRDAIELRMDQLESRVDAGFAQINTKLEALIQRTNTAPASPSPSSKVRAIHHPHGPGE